MVYTKRRFRKPKNKSKRNKSTFKKQVNKKRKHTKIIKRKKRFFGGNDKEEMENQKELFSKIKGFMLTAESDRANTVLDKLRKEKGEEYVKEIVNFQNKDEANNTLLHMPFIYSEEDKPEEEMMSHDNAIEFIRLLLNNGAIMKKNEEGNTPLHLACMKDQNGRNIEIIEQLTSFGNLEPYINEVNNLHQTPFYLACLYGDGRSAMILLQKGAKNIPDKTMITPLHILCRIGGALRLEIAKQMITAGENPNVLDNYSFTPLYYVILYNTLDSMRFLIKNNVNINFQSDTSMMMTPLIYAVKYYKTEREEQESEENFQRQRKDREQIIRMLLEYHADPNKKDIDEMTPLHWAVLKNIQSVVEIFIRNADVDVDIPNVELNTPLHTAITTQNLNIIKKIISKHPDITKQNVFQLTPLQLLLDLYSPDKWIFFYAAAMILLEVDQDKVYLYEGKEYELLKKRNDGKTLINILEEIYSNHTHFQEKIKKIFTHMLEKLSIKRENISDDIRNAMGLVEPQPQN